MTDNANCEHKQRVKDVRYIGDNPRGYFVDVLSHVCLDCKATLSEGREEISREQAEVYEATQERIEQELKSGHLTRQITFP